MATPSPVYLFKHVKRGLRLFKMIASSGFLTAIEGTKFVFGRCSAPNPTRGAFSAPRAQTPYSWFNGQTSKGREERGGKGGKERVRKKGDREGPPPLLRKFFC